MCFERALNKASVCNMEKNTLRKSIIGVGGVAYLDLFSGSACCI